jgi:ribosome-associated translation inhibitor RaiA
MALPILETATYELTLPSADVVIKYRPFLVKEEKVLLQALESNDDVEIKNAICDIVSTCTFGQVNARAIPTFDLEYIFLQIRAKSVGEIAKVRLKCPDDNETHVNHEIDLSKIDVQVDDEHTNEVVVNDKIKIIMKYPTIDTVDPKVNVEGMKTQQVFDMITNCIHSIIEGEQEHNVKDYTQDDLNKFIESLDRQAFNKLNKFFETMPQLRHEIEVENPKTKVKSKVVLKGAQDFFVLPSLTTA